MAEPAPFRRAFDETRDVGEDEVVVLPAHDTEVRLERGERIVGDLGLGRADHGDERRLPRVREPDERGVGHQLELELEPPLLAVLTLLGEARGPARVRQEPRVPAPALPAARREPSIAVVDQVGEQLAVHRADDRPLRHVDDQVGTALPVQLLALAVRPRAGLAVRDGRETPATRPRCDWRAATRRHHGRRHRRRDRLWERAIRGGTRRSPRRRRHPSRCSARYRRSRTYMTRIRRRRVVASLCGSHRSGSRPRARRSSLWPGAAAGTRACPRPRPHRLRAPRPHSRPRRRPRRRRPARPPRAPRTRTTTTTARPGLQITGFTVSPASPGLQRADEIQLQWNAPGATTVDLAIDGAKFASYAGGAQDHLEYFACDGKAHTYTLTAHSATATATATRTVTSTVG